MLRHPFPRGTDGSAIEQSLFRGMGRGVKKGIETEKDGTERERRREGEEGSQEHLGRERGRGQGEQGGQREKRGIEMEEGPNSLGQCTSDTRGS